MPGSQIAVVVVWLAYIAGALSSGISMGTGPPWHANGGEPFPPPNIALILLSFGFVACRGIPLEARNSLRAYLGNPFSRLGMGRGYLGGHDCSA
jgi:hypothetical protein